MIFRALSDFALLLGGIYFISLGLSHVRPRVFATVGSIAISGVNAQLAGGCVVFLGIMLFLNDFLSGRFTDALLLGLVCIGGGIFWVRAERIDIVARQRQPIPAIGYCYLLVGVVTAFYGLWSILPA